MLRLKRGSLGEQQVFWEKLLPLTQLAEPWTQGMLRCGAALR